MELNMTTAVCPSCGKGNVVPGILQSTGTMHFRPNGVKFMTLRTADITIGARMCGDCGIIYLRGDLEKLHQLQNQTRRGASSPDTRPVAS